MRPNALAAVAAMGVVKHAVADTKVADNALATVQSLALKGGQMPLYRRLPQRGFNKFKLSHRVLTVVNLGDLSKIKGSVVDKDSLVKAGLVRANAGLIKILGQGDVGSALTIKVDKISQSAASKIEAAGGTLELNAPVTESSNSDQASAAAESPKAEPVSEDAPVNSKEESTPENDSSPEEDTTEEVADSDDDNADDGDAEIQASAEGIEEDDSTDADSEEKSSEGKVIPKAEVQAIAPFNFSSVLNHAKRLYQLLKIPELREPHFLHRLP